MPRMVSRILIAEDEPLTGFDIAATLKALGYEPVGPAPTVKTARELLAAGVDGAIVDYDLCGEPADALIQDLVQKAVPFVVSSGEMTRIDLGEGSRSARFGKPMLSEDLIDELRRLM